MLVWDVGCMVGDGDFFSFLVIFLGGGFLLGCMTVGLHELFFMRSFVEIAAYYWAAYRGWGFLLGCWAA